ncbi:cancer-related nucleoside-triphosphatase homolog isoform X2 [Oscarella lobularis]|uniref:cancer-related nucleoside-triphosphatase homolog isoform X2 n=1 Tax=Oscarella lobularis TaxID=121494 RepID=UPI003313B2A2
MHKQLLPSGPPGVGKTTLVRHICDSIRRTGVAIQGFYTEEVRETTGDGQRVRIGFDVVTTSGIRAPLARTADRMGKPGESGRRVPFKVGKYVVDVAAFESVVMPLLSVDKDSDAERPLLFVIDEIGKMEMFSESFVAAVRTLFDSDNARILATVPLVRSPGSLPFVERLKARKDVKLCQVSKSNRERLKVSLPAEVASMI